MLFLKDPFVYSFEFRFNFMKLVVKGLSYILVLEFNGNIIYKLINKMDLETNTLNKQISDVDEEIATLMEKKKELINQKNERLPNALSIIMSRDSRNKRKRDILEDSDFKTLKEKIEAEDKSDVKRTQQNVLGNLSEEEKKLVTNSTKKLRRTYSQEAKDATAKFFVYFSLSSISKATSTLEDTLKQWKKEGTTSSTRGRKVIYPQLEDHVKKFVRSEREKRNHLSVRRLI